MKLNGKLALAVPAPVAAEAFRDAGVLAQFLPGTSELTRSGPSTFDFMVIKDIGVMTLRLPGTLAVVALGQGLRFDANAKHLLGGSATLMLYLEFAPDGAGCVLSYDGTLESTGLVGRALRDRADQVQTVLAARIAAVTARIEKTHRSRTA